MVAVNPYLNFNGNAEEAFNFYKSVFGGEFSIVSRFKDMPQEHTMPEGEANKILHIALPLKNGTVLMGSDVPAAYGGVTFGSNFNISIHPDDEQETDMLFNSLAAGGQATMPLQKTFWGSYFGMLKDKFGVQWMLSYEYNR
jgi:PhnB protein